MVIFLVLGTCVAVVVYMPSKAVVALSVALVIAVAMCVYLYLYPRGTSPEATIPATLPVPQPEWVKTVTEVSGGRTHVYVTNICPWCRPELTKTIAKATVGPWEWNIVRIAEAEYIRYGDEPDVEVYTAREGCKLVVITVRTKLLGEAPSIDDFDAHVVSNSGKVYPSMWGSFCDYDCPTCLKRVCNASKDIIEKALEVDLGWPASGSPMCESDLVFELPQAEKPAKLIVYMKLGSGEELRKEIPLP
jgi:hypothetical protein